MKGKLSISFLTLFVFTLAAFGQLDEYQYSRTLSGVTGQARWYKIELPDDIFAKTRPGLADVRIYGITSGKDTVEAPYLLRVMHDQMIREKVVFEQINQSGNKMGYYFTFEVATDQVLNLIDLDFKNQNFDWKIQLEGSNDQKDWFTLLDQYRIISIRNDLTNYAFTRLRFPNAKYQYYRLMIPAENKPELNAASIFSISSQPGRYRDYLFSEVSNEIEGSNKQSITHYKLQSAVSVSSIRVKVGVDYDYYRPVTISYLADSFKTETGWKYRYRKLTSGTLSSLEPNTFDFQETVVRQIQIVIRNQDNAALPIEKVTARGGVHELITRITEQADYYLVYGNKKVQNPQYDISNFQNQIPEVLPQLSIGMEHEMTLRKDGVSRPLFSNPAVLWGIMIVIALVLGWFATSMIRKP